MALNNEDKADVKRHYGKAIANKVADATRDKLRGARLEALASRPGGNRAKNARKELFKSGVKNVGKDKAIELSKKAFGSRETRAKDWRTPHYGKNLSGPRSSKDFSGFGGRDNS